MSNDITLHDGLAIIHLTLQDGRQRDAIVDAEDFDKVKQYHWYAQRKENHEDAPSAYYVKAITPRGAGRRRLLPLHRLITGTLDAGRKVHVQHLNEDTFDNRKANLKAGSLFENLQLRCGQIAAGYSFKAGRGKYEAQIRYAGKARFLGMFRTQDEAAAAYEPFRRARLADPSDALPWDEFKAKVLSG